MIQVGQVIAHSLMSLFLCNRMIWGGGKTKELLQDRIDELIQPHVEAGTIHRVLCFNEPDKKNQANMEPDRCLEFWPQLEKLGVPLCSPSCANPLGSKVARECTQGVSGCWMRDFMAKLEERGHRCDYLGVHWYVHNTHHLRKRNCS
jgi:Glycosyl hydrolase catalytic core